MHIAGMSAGSIGRSVFLLDVNILDVILDRPPEADVAAVLWASNADTGMASF